MLAGGSIACLLVPQNFCDKTSDIYWAEKLRESLGPDGYALTWISEAKTSGWLMTLLRHVGGFVSGRMRAVILPAGVSTPALALTFESKFEGMYRLLGLHEKTFSSNRKPTSPIPNGYRK